MTSTAADVLRRALELLGPNGERWAQGAALSSPKPPSYCMVSAMTAEHWDDERDSLRFLSMAIGRDGFIVSEWNDAPGRTFAEVKAAFEKAITLAEQGEAQ